MSDNIEPASPKRSLALKNPIYRKVRFLPTDLSFDLLLIRVLLHQKPYATNDKQLKHKRWAGVFREFNEFAAAKRCTKLNLATLKTRFSRLLDKAKNNQFPDSPTHTGLTQEEFDEFKTYLKLLYQEHSEVMPGPKKKVVRTKSTTEKPKTVTSPRSKPSSSTQQTEKDNDLFQGPFSDEEEGVEMDEDDELIGTVDEDDIMEEDDQEGDIEEEEELSHKQKRPRNGKVIEKKKQGDDGDTVPEFLQGLQNVLLNVEKARIPNIINNAGGSPRNGADLKKIAAKCDHLQRDVDELKYTLSDINVKLNKIMELINA